MNVFTDNLDRLLKERKMTQKRLAEETGISTTTINTWFVRGSVPAADIAVRVAEKLNVTVEYLVTGKTLVPDKPQVISQKVLKLAEDIFRLPVEYQEIIRQNVESYKALCFKLEKASLQGTG